VLFKNSLYYTHLVSHILSAEFEEDLNMMSASHGKVIWRLNFKPFLSLQLKYCIIINENKYIIILQVARAFKNLLLCVKNDQSGSVDPTQFRNVVGQFKVCHTSICTYKTFSWIQGFTEFKNKICLVWIFCWRRAAGLPRVCLKDVRMAPWGHEQVIFLTLNDRFIRCSIMRRAGIVHNCKHKPTIQASSCKHKKWCISWFFRLFIFHTILHTEWMDAGLEKVNREITFLSKKSSSHSLIFLSWIQEYVTQTEMFAFSVMHVIDRVYPLCMVALTSPFERKLWYLEMRCGIHKLFV
jgi:hypothetical protein